MQLKKKLFLILACVVSICCLMAAKSSDNSEIEQVLNDFFETKEMNFASSEDISLNNFFTTYTRETLTTKTFYKLFLFEKQVRLENDPDILNETFDVEINDIAVDNNSAKVTAYEYYEYELSYADGEKSSRGTTYAIELERENGEWRINNISTNSELEELVEDAPDVQMLFEDESTPVSDPDTERAHQQAEVLAEQADVERTERAAYTFHG